MAPGTRFPLALVLAALLAATPTFSATVRPLALDEIVQRAETVFVGEAVRVRSEWETSAQGRHIITIVTFKVERTLKGQAAAEIDLEFLGGEIAGLVMEVDGVPRFHVGDRDVLFVSPTRHAVSALVGMSSGRFRLLAGRDRVTRVYTHDGRPFLAASVPAERSRTMLAQPAAPMTQGDFESLVRSVLAAPGAAR